MSIPIFLGEKPFRSLALAAGAAGAAAALIALAPFSAYAASLSIQSLSPGSSVDVGEPVSFSVGESGFTNPTYGVSDSFGGSTVVNGDIGSSTGVFSWTPSTRDVGVHALTVSVSDSLGHHATAMQSITVATQSLAIQSLSPSNGSVVAGNPVTFTAAATGFNNPVYSVSDSFGGSTLSGGDINASTGAFFWVPAASDVGSHTLTVKAANSHGNSATTSFAFAVEPSNNGTATSTGLTSAQARFVNRFIRNLYFGLQGSDVRGLQQLLSGQGLYTGPVTGYFDSQVRGAVGRFQYVRGAPQVEQVGPQTLSALGGVLESLDNLASTLTQPQSTSTSTSSPWGWRWPWQSSTTPASLHPFFNGPMHWSSGFQGSWHMPFMNRNGMPNFSHYSDNDQPGRSNR